MNLIISDFTLKSNTPFLVLFILWLFGYVAPPKPQIEPVNNTNDLHRRLDLSLRYGDAAAW